jgi:HSP20 family protein
MALMTFDSVEGLMRLQEELDRFFGKPPYDLGLTGPNVFPPVNVFTDKAGFVVQAEVPGVQPDQLQVQVDPGRLTVSGERTLPTGKEVSYHRRERRYGRFSRTIQLPPDVDSANARAELRNGLLTIHIPKQAAAKPRQIEVRAA